MNLDIKAVKKCQELIAIRGEIESTGHGFKCITRGCAEPGCAEKQCRLQDEISDLGVTIRKSIGCY